MKPLVMLFKRLSTGNFLIPVTLGFIIMTVSCDLDEGENYIKREDIVPITNFSMPDSAAVNDTVELNATASVGNGCWKNLRFTFEERSDTTNVLRAFGTFESYGSCPDVIVSKDTIINFSPENTGPHYFYVIRNSYQYSLDTLMVLDSLPSGG